MKTSGLSDPMLFLSTRNYIKYKDTERIKKKRIEKINHINITQKNIIGYINIRQSRLQKKDYYEP